MADHEKPDLTATNPATLPWRKSSFSSGHGGACVEVAPVGSGVVLRDSTDPEGPVLAFSKGEWDAFRDGVKSGEFDGTVVV